MHRLVQRGLCVCVCVFLRTRHFTLQDGLCRPTPLLGGSVSGNCLAQDETKSLEGKMVKKISSLLGLDLRVILAHGAGTWCLCKQPQHFCCGICSSMALVGMEVNHIAANQPDHCDIVLKPWRQGPESVRMTPIITKQPGDRMGLINDSGCHPQSGSIVTREITAQVGHHCNDHVADVIKLNRIIHKNRKEDFTVRLQASQALMDSSRSLNTSVKMNAETR